MNIAKEIERDMKRRMKEDKRKIVAMLKDLSGREIGVLLKFIAALKEVRLKDAPIPMCGLCAVPQNLHADTVIEITPKKEIEKRIKDKCKEEGCTFKHPPGKDYCILHNESARKPEIYVITEADRRIVEYGRKWYKDLDQIELQKSGMMQKNATKKGD